MISEDNNFLICDFNFLHPAFFLILRNMNLLNNNVSFYVFRLAGHEHSHGHNHSNEGIETTTAHVHSHTHHTI